MHQRCKHIHLASKRSDSKSCVIARAPKERQCESCACIFVLVRSPVTFEGEFKAKLFCFFFTEAIKGKVQVACCFQSGSTWQAGRIRTGQHWCFVSTPVYFPELISSQFCSPPRSLMQAVSFPVRLYYCKCSSRKPVRFHTPPPQRRGKYLSHTIK